MQPAEDPEAGRNADDRAMLAGIRRGEERAIERFHATYALRLADIGRDLGVPRDERESTVLEFLSVLVESLYASRVLPRSLTAYVTASFCNFVRDRQRASATRRQREEDACAEIGPSGERAALDSCSEYTVRAASGTDAAATGSTARTRFVRTITAALSHEDRRLLEYRSKLPLREAAGLMNMTYGNAKVRMFRIRAQLVARAREASLELSAGDRAELAPFLKRAGLWTEEGAAHD